jgi:hypothetical protein
MLKPLAVKALPGFRLWLRYSDDTEGEVDLSNLAGKGVFKIWDDPDVYEQVHVGEHGELQWSDDTELCADALYLRLTGKSPEELFAEAETAIYLEPLERIDPLP